MSRLVTADICGCDPFDRLWSSSFSPGNADSKVYEKHTYFIKGSKLHWKWRNKQFLKNSCLSFCCKVDKDFVTNTSGNFSKSLEMGSNFCADKKRDWETLRAGNRVRWAFRDWKCQLFTMPTNYSSPGRCYYIEQWKWRMTSWVKF